MTEEAKRDARTWKVAAASTAGFLLLAAGLVWLYLPDIAAFGLRYDLTRNAAKETLIRLGPRAARQVFERHEHFTPNEWYQFVGSLVLQAENEESIRNQLVKSVTCRNAGGIRMETFLHWAAAFGCSRLVEAIVASGENPDVRDLNYDSPLHWAARVGRPDTAELLLALGANVNARNHCAETPLQIAVWQKHRGISSCFLFHGCAWTDLLQKAYVGKHCRMVQLLTSSGADVEATDEFGMTPLHLAAGWGDLDLAQALLLNGANTKARDNAGCTPLWHAAAITRSDLCKLLIAQGANVNELDDKGYSILDVCSGKETRTLLHRHGAKTGEELEAEAAKTSQQTRQAVPGR